MSTKKRRSSVFGHFLHHKEGFDSHMDARLTNFDADQKERGLCGQVPGDEARLQFSRFSTLRLKDRNLQTSMSLSEGETLYLHTWREF